MAEVTEVGTEETCDKAPSQGGRSGEIPQWAKRTLPPAASEGDVAIWREY